MDTQQLCVSAGDVERALLMPELQGVNLRGHWGQQANRKLGSDLGSCLSSDLTSTAGNDFEKVSLERLKGMGLENLERGKDLQSRPGGEHFILRGYLNVEGTQLPPFTHHEFVSPER